MHKFIRVTLDPMKMDSPTALALWSAVRSTALGCVERWQGRSRLELSANNEKRRRAAALQDLWRSDEHLQARLAANSARPAFDGPWNTVAVVTATTTQKRIVFDKSETQAFYRMLLAQ